MVTPRRNTSPAIILLLLAALFLASCENLFQDSKVLDQIRSDVAWAQAARRTITIVPSANGSTNPSGTTDMKDGFPLAIEVIPDPDYELLGWRKTGGDASVTFQKLTNRAVSVTITGGSATIEPVYEERPRILYSLPTGNNIAKNSGVRAIFNREINPQSLQGGTYRLLKAPQTEVSGQISLLSGTSAVFDPDSDLVNYSTYIISFSSSVEAAIDLASQDYEGLFVMNPAITMRQDYSKEFVTGKDSDLTPPVNASVNILSMAGSSLYTSSPEVSLVGLSADDEGGVSSWYAYSTSHPNSKGAKPNSAMTGWAAYNPGKTITWYLDDVSDGRKGVNVYFMDSTGNIQEQADSVLATIILDRTAPQFSVLSINSHPGKAGYVNSTAATLSLNATDPVTASGEKGSGESNDGTDSAERKELGFWDWTTTAFTDWEPYAASAGRPYTLASGPDGQRLARIRVRDPLGNTKEALASAILDTTAPTLDFSLPDGTLFTSQTTIGLSIAARDPDAGIDPGSGVTKLAILTSTGLASGSAWSVTNGGPALASGTLSGQAGAAPFTAGTTLNLVLSAGQGNKEVQLAAIDALGNQSSVTRNIILDQTAPLAGTLLINNGAATTNSKVLSLSFSGASDPLGGGVNSGLAEMAVSAVNDVGTATWESVKTTTTFELPSPVEGTNTVYLWYKDMAGNISSVASDTITYDITPPSGTATLSTNLTNNASIKVYYSTTGLNMQISNNGTTWTDFETANITSPITWDLQSGAGGSSTNGTRTVYVKFWDEAVGTSNFTVSNPTLVYDTTPPVISSVSLDAGAAYNKDGTVDITLAATDNISPTANLVRRFSNNNSTYTGYYSYGTSFTNWSIVTSTYGGSATNGTRTVYVRVRDQAGNEATASDTIHFDNVAPVVSSQAIAGVAPAGYTATYTMSPAVTLTWSATDNSAGVSYLQFSNNNAAWSGTYTNTGSSTWNLETGAGGSATAMTDRYVYFMATDLAGNTSTVVSDSIYWDNTKPVPGTFSIQSGNPATSTNRSNTSLYPSATDTGSGLYQMRFNNSSTGWDDTWFAYSTTFTSPAWVLTPGNGTKTVYVQYRDKAGNWTNLVSDTITLSETYGTMSFKDVTATFNSSAIDASYMVLQDIVIDTGTPNRFYVFKTKEGNYGKMVINYTAPASGYNNISYTLWNSAGTALQAVSNWAVPNSNYLDFEAKTFATTYNSTIHDFAQWGSRFYRYNCYSFEWTGN